MSELLIKISTEYGYESGDIVIVMPDGHQWGSGELDTSVFRIVKFPGVSLGNYIDKPLMEQMPATAADNIPALLPALRQRQAGPALRRRYAVDQNNNIIDKRGR